MHTQHHTQQLTQHTQNTKNYEAVSGSGGLRSIIRQRRMTMTLALLAAIVAVVVFGRGSFSVAAENDDSVRLTIAAYNVENFFDAHNDPYTSDETMRPKAIPHLEKLAEVIRETKADFLGVTEMENEGALVEFRDTYLEDMDYDKVWVSHRSGVRGINNGIMSRVPIRSVTIYRFMPLRLEGDDGEWRFARDLVHARVEPIEGVTVHVFVCHLKSKRTVDGDKESIRWRSAEATALRGLVDELLSEDPKALIAVTGDLNDTADSVPLQLVRGDELPKARQLVDVHDHLDGEESHTYLREPYVSKIDYILVSQELADHLVEGSAKVIHLDDMELASDHAPVVASFDISE